VWAQSNKMRVKKMIAVDRMTHAGLRVVEAAKASGDWDRVTSAREIEEAPEDLLATLAADPESEAAFGALPSSFWPVAAAIGPCRANRRLVRRSVPGGDLAHPRKQARQDLASRSAQEYVRHAGGLAALGIDVDDEGVRPACNVW
jgi:hypothetical protein